MVARQRGSISGCHHVWWTPLHCLSRPPKNLSQLVAAAKSVEVSAASDQRARDAMSYTITVEDSGRSTVLTQSDVTMTREFAELLAWLQEHAASR